MIKLNLPLVICLCFCLPELDRCILRETLKQPPLYFFININSSQIHTSSCEDSAVSDVLGCPGNGVQQESTQGKSVSFCRNYVFVLISRRTTAETEVDSLNATKMFQ